MLKKFALILFAAMSAAGASAQNNTSSPYTRYGYGELTEPGFGYSKSMGGISAALRNKSYINSGNPASYTGIDTLGFRFEFGASAKYSVFSDKENSQSSWDQNFDYLAMQFPIKKWLGVSLGLQPYSFVGYEFGNKSVDQTSISSDTLAYTNSYSGSGDLSQVYFGLGVNPFGNLNLGVNGYFNFGSIDHVSRVDFDNSLYHSTVQTSSLSVHDWNVSFGAQYDFNLGKEQNLTWGATFELPSTMKAKASKEIETALVDTVNINFDNSFGLPLSLGTGFVYTYKNKLNVGVDYKFQKWSDVEYFGEKNFNDRNRFAVGAEWLPSALDKHYFKRVSYRLGASRANSYYKVNGQDFNLFTASAGLGFPLKKSLNPTMLNLGFEYGRAGKKSDDLILEQYCKISLNLTINEVWFVKRKFE